jgi:cytoskeletal protein CcmA (bactofilin family)
MLSKNKESLENNMEQTFLGKGAFFNGNLSFKGTLCIDGTFTGQINTSDILIITEDGKIEADIHAGTVICEGQVKGNIVASEKVELRPKSKIIGDIESPSLTIEVGARLDGKCNMTSKKNNTNSSM